MDRNLYETVGDKRSWLWRQGETYQKERSVIREDERDVGSRVRVTTDEEQVLQ